MQDFAAGRLSASDCRVKDWVGLIAEWRIGLVWSSKGWGVGGWSGRMWHLTEPSFLFGGGGVDICLQVSGSSVYSVDWFLWCVFFFLGGGGSSYYSSLVLAWVYNAFYVLDLFFLSHVMSMLIRVPFLILFLASYMCIYICCEVITWSKFGPFQSY